jgi:hypothetical protein
MGVTQAISQKVKLMIKHPKQDIMTLSGIPLIEEIGRAAAMATKAGECQGQGQGPASSGVFL